MENQIKVGQSCEVAVITDNSEYRPLYNIGSTGIIRKTFYSGAVSMFVGKTNNKGKGNWYVKHECYEKTGKLTIKSLK